MGSPACSETESAGQVGPIVSEQKFERQLRQYIKSTRVGDEGQFRAILQQAVSGGQCLPAADINLKI